MQELTIVWQRARKSAWESSWIEYLFRNIPHTTIENLDHTQFIDNSVIVEAICWAPYHNAYIDEMAKRGLKFGMIHLTDESTKDNIDSYRHCRFVLRNYYRGEGLGDNVMHIPLGWNDGVTDVADNLPSAQRKNTWGYVGERWDHNRNTMASALQTVPNGILYVVHHTGPRLTPVEMSKIYRDCIFVPCPRGALIIDSFRVTEALEAGCIPIVEKSNYWKNMHGADFPAIQIDNWHEVPNIMQQYVSNPPALESLRLHCNDWWTDRKNYTTNSVTDLVKKTM